MSDSLKLVAGGRPGVERAALDAAIEMGIYYGGWCPPGRLVDDGRLPERYLLHETPAAGDDLVTDWNVRDSDGTLLLSMGPPEGGCATVVEAARERKKACLIVDLDGLIDFDQLWRWVEQRRIKVLNVAGPLEREQPGIYDRTRGVLLDFLSDQPVWRP